MLKMKNILPVFVLLLFLGVANTAYAQLSCNVASTPVSRDTDTGLTEPAGDLIFNCTAGPTATAAATLTIDYGTSITNNTAFPTLNAACNPAHLGTTCAGGPIRIVSVTGFPGGAPSISSVSNTSGQIVVNVPAQPAPATSSFTLSGVLLGLAGSGKTTVQANVSSSPGSNVLITAGQNVATVVTSVLPGITTPTLVGGAGVVLSNGTIITPGFTIRVQENYIDMFRTLSQFNQGASTQGVQLLFTFSGVPAGITLGGCSATLTDTAGATTGAVTATTSVTSTAPTIVAEISNADAGIGGGNGADLTAIERVTLSCTTFTIGSTATVPLTPGTITATVTLAPVGTAFGSGNTVLTGATTPVGLVPRYASNPLPAPPLTVLNIVSATTNLLFPFVAVGNGFDTGFAIANTSTDPYGFSNGGARPQSGTVAMFFYPSSGSAFCVTTGGTASLTPGGTACSVMSTTAVGQGLSSGGVVSTGASWVVLGSEIFRQVSGAPSVFTGYAFGVTNFTNAHATVFVADAAFSGKFTAGGPALVVPSPAVVTRSAAAFGESLGH